MSNPASNPDPSLTLKTLTEERLEAAEQALEASADNLKQAEREIISLVPQFVECMDHYTISFRFTDMCRKCSDTAKALEKAQASHRASIEEHLAALKAVHDELIRLIGLVYEFVASNGKPEDGESNELPYAGGSFTHIVQKATGMKFRITANYEKDNGIQVRHRITITEEYPVDDNVPGGVHHFFLAMFYRENGRRESWTTDRRTPVQIERDARRAITLMRYMLNPTDIDLSIECV